MVIIISGSRGRSEVELALDYLHGSDLAFKDRGTFAPCALLYQVSHHNPIWERMRFFRICFKMIWESAFWKQIWTYENFNLLHQRSTKRYSKKVWVLVGFWRLIWLNLFAHIRQCRLDVTKSVCVSVCWGNDSG